MDNRRKFLLLGIVLFIIITGHVFAAQKKQVVLEGKDVDNVVSRIEETFFSEDKLLVVKDYSKGYCFYSEDLKRVIDRFDFSTDKLSALKILKNNIIDPVNKSIVYGSFSFSGDKKEAIDILESGIPCVAGGNQEEQSMSEKEPAFKTGSLELRSLESKPRFVVYFDGQEHYFQTGYKIVISGFVPGRYMLKIVESDKSTVIYEKQVEIKAGMIRIMEIDRRHNVKSSGFESLSE